MATTNKKFNLTIAPLWVTKNGHMMSIEIGPEHFDKIQQLEKGGKLMVKMLPEDKRRSETSPNAYLEYISKEDVQAFKNKNATSGGSFQRASSYPSQDDDTL
jgi:hypothetical protein